MHPDPHEITGTIATPRHQLVRYRAGPESGCVFDCDDKPGCGKCFDGLTLTIEIADMADARAMLAVLSQSTAARDVLAERQRQIEVEGFSPPRDDQWQDGQIAEAAACYALHAHEDFAASAPAMWPWAANWWKQSTPRRDLVKAAALILAEIERLDRQEAKP